MSYTYDRDAAERRITAYLDFLMAAYGTDANGLAKIADVSRDDVAEYMAETDYENINAAVLSKLGNLTGISFSWLFAEQGGEIPRVVRKYTDERPTIDYDEMNEATTKVKATAAALSAVYLQDAGRLTYDTELFEILSHQLHEAARYFVGVLETL